MVSLQSRLFRALTAIHRPDADVAALREAVTLLFDLNLVLLEEVEALRQERILDAQERGVPPSRTAYARAYAETAVLNHNGAGVTPGPQKVLLRFLDPDAPPSPFREELLLKRLGLSPAELAQVKKDVEFVEQLS